MRGWSHYRHATHQEEIAPFFKGDVTRARLVHLLDHLGEVFQRDLDVCEVYRRLSDSVRGMVSAAPTCIRQSVLQLGGAQAHVIVSVNFAEELPQGCPDASRSAARLETGLVTRTHLPPLSRQTAQSARATALSPLRRRPDTASGTAL